MVFLYKKQKKKGDKNMKKHLLIAGLLCVAIIPPAFAVTKCVKLTSSTTCSTYSGERGQSNWSATCGGVSIQGVAFCGSQNGGSQGATSTAVTISTTSDDNKYCWCRMISPAVSRWVFNNASLSAYTCANDCAYNCAYYAQIPTSFRSALFSNLSD